MTEPAQAPRKGYAEGIITAVSAGVWLVMVGAIFLTTPNLLDRTVDFIGDIHVVQVPGTPIFALAPFMPRSHVAVYNAVAEYSIIWGVFQVIVLATRFVVGSSIGLKARTASSVVTSLGTYYLVGMFLNSSTTLERWFLFWASIIMLIGASLLVRAAILAFGRTWR